LSYEQNPSAQFAKQHVVLDLLDHYRSLLDMVLAKRALASIASSRA
jgi:hypothetical protein